MNLNYDLFTAVEQAELQLRRTTHQKSWASLTVTITATLSSPFKGEKRQELGFKLKTRKVSDLILLSLVSWYTPSKSLGFLLREEIERFRNKPGYEILDSTLKSQGWARNVISDLIREKGPSHFFGNVLETKKLQNLIKLFTAYSFNPDLGPSLPEKRRIGVGYSDKGSSADLAMGGALGRISDRALQLKIEHNRNSQKSILLLLEGFNCN